MSPPAVTKQIPNVGEVTYKIASSRDELERALQLVYREYLRRGYILPKYYKSGLRITLHNAVPGTTVFIALHEGEVVGAVTLIPDSPLGLPMDQEYQSDVDSLRQAGRKICEVGQLATQTELFGQRFFSMFNFNKLSFVLGLLKPLHDYAAYAARLNDICIVVSPKATIFKFLFFEPIGPVKYYGFDRISVKRKPAVACRLDLHAFSEQAEQKRLGLYKMVFGEQTPPEVFDGRYAMTVEDLKYFFVEKSDIFRQATPAQRQQLQAWYRLSDAGFAKLLATRPTPSRAPTA